MKFEQEFAIEEAQEHASRSPTTQMRNDLINTRLAARIMIFLFAASVLSSCASAHPEFVLQSCAITDCDVK
jgi:hypothetical protein